MKFDIQTADENMFAVDEAEDRGAEVEHDLENVAQISDVDEVVVAAADEQADEEVDFVNGEAEDVDNEEIEHADEDADFDFDTEAFDDVDFNSEDFDEDL